METTTSARQSSHADRSPAQPSPPPRSINPSIPNTNPRRFEESWVEVTSQPSSSSLSSIGDEIVTTGLRVRRGPYDHRRRRSRLSLPRQQTAVPAACTSSQDEYDESESESESEAGKLLASSTSAEPDSDDADDATALGHASADRPVFRPQPNAFSLPSAGRRRGPARTATASSVPSHPHGGFTRPSFSQRPQTRPHRTGGPSFMGPSVREDNDAALRASLTTLLSCAAAARGLPKPKDEAESWHPSRNGVGPSDQPVELCFMPESELDRAPPARQPPPATTARHATDATSPARPPNAATDRSKRSPAPPARVPRAGKKKQVATAASEDALISPTLLTWVVSAGVVVLVSVVGFGAGYVIGREVGRQEAHDALSLSVTAANETSHTGRDVIRSSAGLRKLRWGAGAVGRSIITQA